MKTYYYAHTGHRIGLDRFRRAVAILNGLDSDITLLTSDFRIAQVAREFGIEKSVGIDVVRNIPQIAENGDRLIFDSDEANPLMLEDMKQYFSTFIPIKNDTIVVEPKFFDAKKREKSVKISYFFGDDDYEKDLERHFDLVADLNPHLQLGFYYFLDYEDMLKEKFENYFEFEEYDEMIMSSEIVVTCSPQTVFDALASGAKPIYIQREDYTQDYNHLFDKLNIPIIKNYNKNDFNIVYKAINERKYVDITQNEGNIVELIKENLDL